MKSWILFVKLVDFSCHSEFISESLYFKNAMLKLKYRVERKISGRGTLPTRNVDNISRRGLVAHLQSKLHYQATKLKIE